MNPLDGKFSFNYGNKNFNLNNGKDILLNNQFLKRRDTNWYCKCTRYGWIDPFDNDRVTKEFLFFTKPDLNIIQNNDEYSPTSEELAGRAPVIYEILQRQPKVITQLQHGVEHEYNINPGNFMYLLSNAKTSKLELPGISGESHESTSTLMGTNIQYRGHSFKSDNGYDFTLSFMDTAYLEVYSLAKAYDEYIKLCKRGILKPKKEYIVNHIDSTMFSIYKFLIGSDGETILYYAKLTGCYIADVPRSDLADPGDDGIKFSLSFHANYVEDMNPYILAEFNAIAIPPSVKLSDCRLLPVYDSNVGVNNEWGMYPQIQQRDTLRSKRRDVKYDYYLRWFNLD